jgi:hypothetical protein
MNVRFLLLPFQINSRPQGQKCRAQFRTFQVHTTEDACCKPERYICLVPHCIVLLWLAFTPLRLPRFGARRGDSASEKPESGLIRAFGALYSPRQAEHNFLAAWDPNTHTWCLLTLIPTNRLMHLLEPAPLDPTFLSSMRTAIRTIQVKNLLFRTCNMSWK